ncbi:Transcription factor Adf1like [Caligus rogercresseyi]|uniref:Transcription factor Adf1like n=1 Tax=Caligus rogercresseyi TaxID=217165 RepID=A0A7T8KL93_CALRO|nr:Transcription factor Adf1like [Caligus rogercresseyi]
MEQRTPKKSNIHVIQPMDKRLATEIRKYELIYNTLCSEYKDARKTELAWKEIGLAMDLTPYECKRRWKNMRDRYVRMRKTMGHGVPEIFECFSFLNPHIKHKDIENEKKLKCQGRAVKLWKVGR